MRHRTKAEVFSFNKNDNEAYDEDHESNQSVDAADLNFDEVYWIMLLYLVSTCTRNVIEGPFVLRVN